MSMQATVSHTPGPWKVIGDGVFQNHSPVAHLLNDQISRIATVHHVDDGFDPNNLLADAPAIAQEAQANARLIASAPELFAFVDRVRVWLISPNLSPATLRTFETEAVNLISKAKGA